jgi:hypothetical protein
LPPFAPKPFAGECLVSTSQKAGQNDGVNRRSGGGGGVKVPPATFPFAFAGELIECSFQRAAEALLFGWESLVGRFGEPGLRWEAS